jgi:hypothetical protein
MAAGAGTTTADCGIAGERRILPAMAAGNGRVWGAQAVVDFVINYAGADRERAEWTAWQLEPAGAAAVLQAWDFGRAANSPTGCSGLPNRPIGRSRVFSPAYLASWVTGTRSPPLAN